MGPIHAGLENEVLGDEGSADEYQRRVVDTFDLSTLLRIERRFRSTGLSAPRANHDAQRSGWTLLVP
eukprot:1867345-Prymnesium_polylepis.1